MVYHELVYVARYRNNLQDSESSREDGGSLLNALQGLVVGNRGVRASFVNTCGIILQGVDNDKGHSFYKA